LGVGGEGKATEGWMEGNRFLRVLGVWRVSVVKKEG
jgi:hypothetical protein